MPLYISGSRMEMEKTGSKEVPGGLLRLGDVYENNE